MVANKIDVCYARIMFLSKQISSHRHVVAVINSITVMLFDPIRGFETIKLCHHLFSSTDILVVERIR